MKKLLIIIYIIIFVALAYYVMNLFIDRNENITQPQEIKIDTPQHTKNTTKNDQVTDINETNEDTHEKIKKQEYEITRDDCFDDCTNVNDNVQDYCKEVCGLSEQRYTNGCDVKNGIEKDYCWKDSAIKNSDYSICEKISDNNIYETCKTRITEDIINNSL